MAAYGIRNRSVFKIDDLNEMMMKIVYRRHNAYVMQTAPKDKLLVFNVKEGWEPLCKFLGVEVPSKPFPRKNIRGGITKEMMETNYFFIRMQREMVISSLFVAALFGYGCYKAYKQPLYGLINPILNIAQSIRNHLMF